MQRSSKLVDDDDGDDDDDAGGFHTRDAGNQRVNYK